MNVTAIRLNIVPPVDKPAPSPVIHSGGGNEEKGNLRIAFGDEKSDTNSRR